MSALALAVKSARRGGLFESALAFTTLALAACMSYVQPWYATWLLPFALAPVSRERRLGIAIYTAAMPALYLTGAAGALAIVVVHGIGLALLLRPVAIARFFGSDAEPRRASPR
jgi:hypothetical protein